MLSAVLIDEESPSNMDVERSDQSVLRNFDADIKQRKKVGGDSFTLVPEDDKPALVRSIH